MYETNVTGVTAVYLLAHLSEDIQEEVKLEEFCKYREHTKREKCYKN